MAVGHSDDVDAEDAIAAVIEQCRASLGGLNPQAGILFAGASAQRDYVGENDPGVQFRGDEIVRHGIVVMLFSGPVAFSTAIGTGWRTLGAVGTVTRSEAGAVHEIDGRPALEFLSRYIDVTGPAAFGNPLAIVEEGATSSYLRAIQGSDSATGSVLLTGEVPVGATVQLTTADTDDILAGTKGALAQA